MLDAPDKKQSMMKDIANMKWVAENSNIRSSYILVPSCLINLIIKDYIYS